jgi:hypothetical protein
MVMLVVTFSTLLIIDFSVLSSSFLHTALR